MEFFNISSLIFAAAFAICLSVYYGLNFALHREDSRNAKRIQPTKEGLLFILSIFVILLFTIFPITFFAGSDVPGFITYPPNLNLIPFAFIRDMAQMPSFPKLLNIVGNIGLFIPLGILCSMNRKTAVRRILLGIALAIFIEIFQYIIMYVGAQTMRVSDIDDVILNAAGLLVGFAITSTGKGWWEKAHEYVKRPLWQKGS